MPYKLPDEFVQTLEGVFGKLDQAQQDALTAAFGDRVSKFEAADAAAAKTSQAALEVAMNKKWGSDTAHRLYVVKDLIRRNRLDQNGPEAAAALLDLLVAAASPSAPPPASPAIGAAPMQSASTERELELALDRFEDDPAKMRIFNDKRHPLHAAVFEERQSMIARLSALRAPAPSARELAGADRDRALDAYEREHAAVMNNPRHPDRPAIMAGHQRLIAGDTSAAERGKAIAAGPRAELDRLKGDEAHMARLSDTSYRGRHDRAQAQETEQGLIRQVAAATGGETQ